MAKRNRRMSVCVGIDLSSRAIDLVRLDEDNDEAAWTRIELAGGNAFERTRSIPVSMPHGSFWDDVYLCAMERPFVRFGQDVIRLAQGATLACVPRNVEVWEVAVSQWKKHMSIPIRDKPSWDRFPMSFQRMNWPQDALDALGVAIYARETNADGVAAQLPPKPVRAGTPSSEVCP
jgi:hypothetical protein